MLRLHVLFLRTNLQNILIHTTTEYRKGFLMNLILSDAPRRSYAESSILKLFNFVLIKFINSSAADDFDHHETHFLLTVTTDMSFNRLLQHPCVECRVKDANRLPIHKDTHYPQSTLHRNVKLEESERFFLLCIVGSVDEENLTHSSHISSLRSISSHPYSVSTTSLADSFSTP